MDDLGYVRGILRNLQIAGKLDGMILNHGTLGNCSRIGQMGSEEWERTFRINVTSCVVLVSLSLTSSCMAPLATPADMRCTDTVCIGCSIQVQEALPLLRSSKGRIIFTSSGAAQNAYSSWGAYGATKAALNHLTMTLKNEEPEVTTVAIRPGVVDTAMQKDIREVFLKNMDKSDQQKFLGAKVDGKLLPPEKPGKVIAELALEAKKDLSGLFLR